MGDKNTSTLQSYIDSATGAAQSVIGSITGNASDQVDSALLMIISHTNNSLERRPSQARQG